MQAASNGHGGVVRRLLAAGAKVDARDTSGQTALILASKVGSDAAVGCLLGAGADPDVQDWRDGRTALSRAAEKGHEGTVEILLNGNAAVDLVDKCHRTPMAWAAMKGHTSVVKLYLRWNASTTTEDDDYDRTPFMWAIKRAMRMLLRF
ncbi:ankyrin repeat domain-containing protein [Aspergillus affinis]|uniref:ankyrin repeat domain-containing protein n=1 Tax=Aspergillus affinis TaxID=1070780 RepID=UPI0022FEFF8A|nr:uncharacterized protein KD926_007703 [Aspergillus affinis]KAI9040760.1 hypothetical protein KD926_007703 [Aspergillus affinis]